MTEGISSQIAPRQLAGFMSELIMNESFRTELEVNTQEVLAKYGVEITDEQLPEVIKLPEMKELTRIVGEYLEKEKFAFPSQLSIQMALPLAFALTVVFVFLCSAKPNVSEIKKAA